MPSAFKPSKMAGGNDEKAQNPKIGSLGALCLEGRSGGKSSRKLRDNGPPYSIRDRNGILIAGRDKGNDSTGKKGKRAGYGQEMSQELTQTAPHSALAGVWQEFLAKQVKAGQLSPSTAQTYSIGLSRFISWGASLPESALSSRSLVLDWLVDLRSRYSAATCNTWLYAVRSFFAWARAQGLVATDPTAGVKALKARVSGHKRNALSNLEVGRLLAAGSVRDRAILHVLAFSGCRGIELISADLSDLTYNGPQVQIRVQGKGSTEKGELIIIASKRAQDALAEWLALRGGADGALFWSLSPRSRGARLSLRGLHQIVKDNYRAAGIVGKLKTTHSLRHSAITAAIRNGASIPDVQAMARHRSAATTMNYYHHQQRADNPAEALIDYDTP